MKYGELSKPPIQSVRQPEYRPAGCFWSHGGTNFENQTYASKKGGAAISSVKGIGICILSVTLVVTSAVAAPKIGEKLLPVVLASAGMALPEGGSSLLRGQMEEIKTGELPQNELPASAAPSEATRSTTQTQQSASKAVAEADFAKTPSDIQKLIDQAKKELANASHDGKIISRQYDNSGATTVYGKVAVQNRTSEKMDIKKVLAEPVDLKIEDKTKPTILIYHTHTTESYQMLDTDWFTKSYQTRSNLATRNMVRVGDEIVAQLEAAGFAVIHDTKIYDATYNGAYYRSEDAIEAYQKKYPQLQVLLDIHRDAIQTNDTTRIKPVATINGKKAAQIMIISGCEGGGVTDFPDWRYNLRFATQLQKICEESYPGLMRPLYFCNRQYNMHKSHCSLLLEMGSDSNTLDEAAYSGRMLGKALAQLLENYVIKK